MSDNGASVRPAPGNAEDRGSVQKSAAYSVVRASKNRLAWLVFERGLADTGGTVEVEELGLEDPDHKRYEASSWTWVRRALRRCQVRPTDVFVDFGSGKGRVVWQAAQYPFARVVGVEISAQLNAVARRNIEGNLNPFPFLTLFSPPPPPSFFRSALLYPPFLLLSLGRFSSGGGENYKICGL